MAAAIERYAGDRLRIDAAATARNRQSSAAADWSIRRERQRKRWNNWRRNQDRATQSDRRGGIEQVHRICGCVGEITLKLGATDNLNARPTIQERACIRQATSRDIIARHTRTIGAYGKLPGTNLKYAIGVDDWVNKGNLLVVNDTVQIADIDNRAT